MVSGDFRRVHIEADRRKPFMVAGGVPVRQPKAPCERGRVSRLLEWMFAPTPQVPQ